MPIRCIVTNYNIYRGTVEQFRRVLELSSIEHHQFKPYLEKMGLLYIPPQAADRF